MNNIFYKLMKHDKEICKNPIEGNGELVLEDPQEYVDLMSNPSVTC